MAISIPARRYSSTRDVEVGRPGKCRVGATLVGAQGRHRGADLVEARPPDALGVCKRPLGVVEVAAQDVASAGDVEEHRRQGVAGEVVEFTGNAPPLLGDRLFGERPARLFEIGDQGVLPIHKAPDSQNVKACARIHDCEPMFCLRERGTLR